ncbi:MAG: YbaB/EbfC family nucleoid-associated protein [Rhodospirillales bacterium]|nr:YbaB/EbfC family nucleoid-associated protein [Rhodospirillales bacterium]
MKNIGQLMKQAQQMQTRMAEMQAKLAEIEMSGQSGGGMVSALMNGKGELKKITLDKAAVDPGDVEILEDLIIAAVADAKNKVEAYVASETQKMMGGLPMPPGMKLPF